MWTSVRGVRAITLIALTLAADWLLLQRPLYTSHGSMCTVAKSPVHVPFVAAIRRCTIVVSSCGRG